MYVWAPARLELTQVAEAFITIAATATLGHDVLKHALSDYAVMREAKVLI